jgi:hypothetical protein
MNLTFPIHLLDHTTASFDSCKVALATRTILIKEQARGTREAHLLEHLRELVWTVEEEDEDGDVNESGRHEGDLKI